MFNELIKNVMNLGIITEDDVKRLTAVELMLLIIERTNGLLKYLESYIHDNDARIKALDDKYQQITEEIKQIILDNEAYFDRVIRENLEDMAISQFNEWLLDGTLESLFNESILNGVNDRIDALEIKPESNLSLQRIGRKLIVGEHINSSSYNPVGKACMIQGGCKIDDSTIAYVLWDSLNTNLNKNKLVIMNINTGVIIKEKELNFGWCNSIAFNNNKIYIAERGRTNNGIAVNNGVIHVVDYLSLDEVSVLYLNLNVNAISIHENELYVLQESQNVIHKYDLEGVSKNSNVILQTNIADLYNQNILVDSNFIYLLSSKPSNYLNVFDFKGNLIKSYNIPRYGGLYYVGEPQFIYDLSNGDMILGSSMLYFNECVNQFFKFNLKKDMNVEVPIINYAETLFVNSEVDYYNPNGVTGNEFTSINEAGNLNLRNYFLNGNNKGYKYTHLTDINHYLRIMNATFNEGLFVQYSKIGFNSCKFLKSINVESDSCCQVRDSEIVFRECEFDAGTSKYCVDAVRHNTLKFALPSFTNYTSDVIGNTGVGNTINFNDYDDMPFVRHSNIKKYNLFSKGYESNFKPGTYNYNTDLSSDEIQKIMDNCTRVKIVYKSFNNTTKVVELVKNSTHDYSFTDTTMSTTNINVRFCKTQLTLTNTGYTITSNVTTKFTNDAWTILNSENDDYVDEFNSIRSIEFLVM